MSSICQICGEPCRGKCGKCKAHLCYRCKPSSPRGRCQLCRLPAAASNVSRARQPIAAGPAAYTPAPRTSRSTPAHTTPYYRPTIQIKAIKDMSHQEVGDYCADLIRKLTTKQARERAYLDRRAARGTNTPTDTAYEADQELETRILAILKELEEEARRQTGILTP